MKTIIIILSCLLLLVGCGEKNGKWSPQSFIGLTKEQVIERLGKPEKIEEGNSPDGHFIQLVYGQNPKDHDTFFFIFDSDKTVYEGMYHGKSLSK